MKDQRIEKFMKAQKAAVKHLKNLPHRLASIVHHNDTDGISSGAILKEALGREGFQTENIPIERVHPSFLPRIHTPERKLIFYADLGSQAARLISGKTLEGTSVIILDHHPPFQEDFPNLIQVNPETFGIDGDLQASAAAVAFFWARTLDEKNDDLAYLAVLGAIGDNQILEGRMTGLNQMALEAALGNGMIHPAPAGPFPFRFPLFKGNWGDQVSREITNLAANGYYRGGAELALAVCLEGPTGESEKFAAKMRELEQDRFRREIERVQSGGIPSEGDIQWVDVADRFYPLGLKAIGIFCEEIGRVKWAYGDKYIVGFQDFPGEVPLLGKFEEEDTKVSMRVPPVLRAEIEKGKKPHLAEILPPAAEEAGGFAEGCHRFAAAGIVPRKRKKELIRALNRILGK